MIFGLTGGIGSGKSLVAKIFETLGCAVFNSDKVAKHIYYDPAVKQKVMALLGAHSYMSDTEINKKYISDKIFNNNGLMLALNKIIHPAVALKFKAFVAANAGKIIVKESALLFEANITNQVDRIILVVAKDEMRIQRVMRRDGLSREEVEMKIKNQLSQDEKIKKSDFIIDNNEMKFLAPQVLDIFKKTTHA